jgi:hypothetical protein
MSLYVELKRRYVIQVGIACADKPTLGSDS